MIILRQKNYATAVKLDNGNVGIGANSASANAQASAFNSLPENFEKMSLKDSVKLSKIAGAQNNAGRIDATRNLGGKEVYQKGNLSAVQANKAGFDKGVGSVSGLSGLKQWGTNTYNNMSKGQQTALKIGGAAALVGGTALAIRGLMNRKKKKEED